VPADSALADPPLAQLHGPSRSVRRTGVQIAPEIQNVASEAKKKISLGHRLLPTPELDDEIS
jgi:hypothetical protein